MTLYEYRVLPAPEKGRKAKGVKTPQARFALTVEDLMNEMAGEGWEYLRADILPSEERAGLTSSVTEWRTLLVFRRPRLDRADAFRARELPAPSPEPSPAPDAEPVAAAAPVASPDPGTPAPGGAPMKPASDDNGVEDASDGSGLGALLKARATAFMPMGADRGGAADGPDDDDPRPAEAPEEAPDRDAPPGEAGQRR